MANADQGQPARYRVWIASCRDCDYRPAPPGAAAAEATALEPAEEEAMSEREAARYVEAFNRAALSARRRVRAVAMPVAVCYRGDPQPGQTLAAGQGRLLGHKSA